MSLLCALGRHRAKPMARWNGGYYFSTCRNCGEPLVRTAFERWHTVPRGYRVVWSATPPPRVRTAALAALDTPSRTPVSPEATVLTAPAEAAEAARRAEDLAPA